MLPVSPRDTAELDRFAMICAKIDDGFTPRTTVLRAAGLTEAAFHELHGRWLVLLASSDGSSAAIRFADTYARARREPARQATAPGADPAWEPDITMEVAALPLGSVLPFVSGNAPDDIARRSTTLARPPASGTSEIRFEVHRAVLPFSPPTSSRR